jgi:membrane-associated phospholipid phosphatase
MRDLGVVEALGDLLPEAAVPVFALLTQLGDIWLFFAVLSLLYWFGDRLPGLALDRRRAALAIALALGALSLTIALKGLFDLPRPPNPGTIAGLQYVPDLLYGPYVAATTASGYGFPSGHALGTTVVWGGLAVVLDASTPRRRALAAGTLVGGVSLARVVLGVHYAVDVLAGIAVGLGYLAVVFGLAGGRTRPALWIAVAVAVGAVAIGGPTFDDAAALGATVGAAATWELVRGAVAARPVTRTGGLLAAAVGFPAFGGLFVAVYALEPPFVPTAATSAAVIAGTLALPLATDRVGERLAPAGAIEAR